jgi:hypothetical protein
MASITASFIDIQNEHVIAGFGPATPLRMGTMPDNRGGRAKPGHDETML